MAPADISFRTALVDAFITRLRGMPRDQLQVIASARTPFEHFYQVALTLATEATQRMGPERAAALDGVLRTRFVEIDATFSDAGPPTRGASSNLRAMAKAAARALLVRDEPMFTRGAFLELFGPFAQHIDLAELEREAKGLSAQNGLRPG
jgi:hypothetical protein